MTLSRDAVQLARLLGMATDRHFVWFDCGRRLNLFGTSDWLNTLCAFVKCSKWTWRMLGKCEQSVCENNSGVVFIEAGEVRVCEDVARRARMIRLATDIEV
jgi:hypothetical protein